MPCGSSCSAEYKIKFETLRKKSAVSFFALNMEFSDCVYMDVQCLRSGEDQCEKATGRRNMEKNWNEEGVLSGVS